jgi:DNA (cytosine-5)-methyltransferase 1
MIKVGSDFSGVGAFNQALIRLGIPYKEVFACDMDKYARQTFVHNYGEPEYYPTNVYNREIPAESLDVYMTSPPCQAFSLAGKRLGKDDKRGILFFNSLEFIQKNQPKYFIFENVKGLLSDDNGKTFSEWINLLGGKSVNGNPILFPYEESVPYHIYWQVLNAKEHGVPQNRERVFIIGIRDDADNNFRFPIEEPLTKRLKDVLEQEVDEKYFLTENAINRICNNNSGYNSEPKNENDIGSTVCASDYKIARGMNVLKVKSATAKGYEEATEGDSINFSVPSSVTRRGRVGKGVAQTLDTSCNQGVIQIGTWRTHKDGKGFREVSDDNCPTIPARAREDGSGQPVIQYNIKRLNQTLKKHKLPKGEVRFVDSYNQTIHENSVCISTRINDTHDRHLWDGYKIRRLTPRECFRLMDFPDSFTWTVSDSQAYKQAGNSIVVNVLYKILKNLNLQ